MFPIVYPELKNTEKNIYSNTANPNGATSLAL